MDFKFEEKVTADVTLEDLSNGFFLPNCLVYTKQEGDTMEIIVKEGVGNKKIIIKFNKK